MRARIVGAALLGSLGLGLSGCWLSFAAAYGGPDRKSDLEARLVRELQDRNLQFAIDFDCRAWGGRGCWEAAPAIQALLSELGVLWLPGSGAPTPPYEIEFLLGTSGSSAFAGLLNLVGMATLWTVIPMHARESTEIVAVLSEPGRAGEPAEATRQLRALLEETERGALFLYGEPVVPKGRRVAASAVTSFDTRLYASSLLPTSWLGGQGQRVSQFAPAWLPETERLRPWIRESIELAARRVLLDLVRHLPMDSEASLPES